MYSKAFDFYATVHDCHECTNLLLPEVLLGAHPTDQPNLDLGSAFVNGALATSMAELRDGEA